MSTQGRGPRLVIVCGLPGAGKTTVAKRLESDLRGVRLCPDEWMERLTIDLWDQAARAKMEALQWELGQRLLELGQTIIIEWGTWSRCERDALRSRARALGAAAELHYVSAPIDVLVERLHRRGRENPPIAFEQIQQWAGVIEAPNPEEMALYDEYTTYD
jgi:predicted kinase